MIVIISTSQSMDEIKTRDGYIYYVKHGRNTLPAAILENARVKSYLAAGRYRYVGRE